MDETIANKLADQRDNDGQQWEDSQGVNLTDELERIASTTYRTSDSFVVYILADASMMLVTDAGWDTVHAAAGEWLNSNGDVIAKLDADGDPIDSAHTVWS